MSRKFLLIPLFAATFLAAPATLPDSSGPILTGSAHAVTNLNSSRSNIAKVKAPKKQPAARATGAKKGGQPAGLAVSDPGADGSKPTKKSNK
jgi:hypothetical protein